ncbi:MAG: HAMP domain-containing histidine kinase [Flavobacteriales bacterium]|nr:HAMP domain-containing histidine kinase [Flavobacteriales bacterium]
MRWDKNIWHTLIGSREEFSGSERTFHMVCLAATLAMILGTTQNIILGLDELVYTMAAVFVLLFFCYILSRVYRKFIAGWGIFVSFCVVILGINYYFNAGIDGPTLITTFIILIFFFAISPVKLAWGFSLLMISLFGVIIYCDFHGLGPNVIPYEAEADKYIDIYFSYTWTLLIVLAIFYRIRSDMKTQNDTLRSQKEALEKSQDELEASNQELNRLFSIISHDIRNPLISIEGYLEVLEKDDLDPADDERMRGELLNLTKSSSSMLDHLLTWSKGQIHGHRFCSKHVQIDEEFEGTLALIEDLSKKKGVVFESDIPDDQQVICDPDLMVIVVRNLLHNALKFTSEGNSIGITSVVQDDHWIMTMYDQGQGMSQEKQDSLFTLKAKSTFGTNNEKGIGLGLILVKEFIDQHNGSISCQSKIGEGTTFIVTIPQKEE